MSKFGEISTFEEYAKLSKKTMSNNGYAIETFHAAVGIVTEVDEVDNAMTKEKFIDELGDICFYLALAHREHVFNFFGGYAAGGNKAELMYRLKRDSINLLDCVKKRVMYKRDNVVEIQRCLSKVSTIVVHLAILLEINVSDILRLNLEKLQGEKGRYKAGYTHEEANNRNLKSEEEAITDNL